jgi:phage N-6-adenine-methyltransferase
MKISREAIEQSSKNEWNTPAGYIESARKVLGGIDLDPATNKRAQKIIRATKFYTREDDGLNHDWKGKVWMNPPYSYGAIKPFVDKFVRHWMAGDITAGIVLTNNNTDTAWFHYLAGFASSLCFPSSRIKFDDQTGKGRFAPMQGQTFFYFGTDSGAHDFALEFQQYGLICHLRD